MRIPESDSPAVLFYRLRCGVDARNMRTLLLLVLAVVLIAAGCGDDGGGGY